jgi:mannose/fructose/N-acetylgalactosamine-specific phosphotransferase system component IIC
MASAALAVCIAYYIISVLDPTVLSWQCLNRPIVVAPLTGLILGDFRTGIIMGASLESIFMGISAIGGAVPADATTSSIIAVAYTILTGASAEEGLAIAMPIGTVLASFSSVIMAAIGSPLAPHWEKLATTNIKKYNRETIAWTLIQPLIMTAILFVSVAYGVEGLQAGLAALPSWVMTGLTASSSMMVAVGFAILTSMIWDGEVSMFFFVGYVLAAYLGLGTLPIAILGAACAVALYFSQKRVLDLKKSLAGKTASADGQTNNEEDFF